MWQFENPVRITFGSGSLGRLARLLGGRRYALVTYGDPHFSGLIERIAGIAGSPQVLLDGIKPNPDFRDFGALCRRFGEADGLPEVIVALGGGSALDAAKVLAAAGGDFAPVKRYLETRDGAAGFAPLPVIAIPTTAGTGSEVTCWATVWDSAAGKKYSLALPGLYPEQALIDPALMLSMPRTLTVSTGLDALSHALESIWNRNANPVSRSLAIAAAREMLETLPKLADNLDDLGLREAAARAALFAGLAFSNTKTALAHSLSYPITLRHKLPHGIACSFSLASVMRSVLGVDEACDEALKQIFGADLALGAERLEDFLRALGVSPRAADHGVAESELLSLLEEALLGERGQNFIGPRDRVLAAFAVAS